MMESMQLDTSEDTQQIVNNDSFATALTGSVSGGTAEDLILRQPTKRTKIRYANSRALLILYGVICVGLGLATIACGAASFIYLPFFETRQSFQVENKWTNSVILWTGFAALALAWDSSLTSIIATITLSVVSIAMGITTFIIHVVNFHFRRKDLEYHQSMPVARHPAASPPQPTGTPTPDLEPSALVQSSGVMRTKPVADINVAIATIGLLSAVFAFLLSRCALQLSARNYGYHLRMDKHRLLLSIVGFVQICIGMLITGWWTGIEALFKGQHLSLHTLPTAEILCHGLIIVCAGAIQMITTYRGSPPLLMSSVVLNGAAMLVAVYFSAYPISVLYVVMQYSSGSSPSGAFTFDAKMFLAIALSLIYIVEIALSMISLLKFIRVISVDRTPFIEFAFQRSHRMLLCVLILLPIFGVMYALVEIFAIGMFFLYKLDFTPLPVISVCSGILVYAAARSGTPVLVAVSLALLGLCISLGARDVYLFIYHTLVFPNVDNGNNPNLEGFNATNVTIHFLQVFLAIGQIVVALIIIVTLVRCLVKSLVVSSRALLKTNCAGQCRLLIALLQTTFGVVIILLGFDIFFSPSEFMRDFGDRSIQLGILLVFLGSLSLSARKHPLLIIPAVCAQLVGFTLIWQESDRFSYLVHNYSQNLTSIGGHESISPTAPVIFDNHLSVLNETYFGLSVTVLTLLLATAGFSVIYLFSAGKFLESCSFSVTNLDNMGYPTDEFDKAINGEMLDIPRNINVTHSELLSEKE